MKIITIFVAMFALLAFSTAKTYAAITDERYNPDNYLSYRDNVATINTMYIQNGYLYLSLNQIGPEEGAQLQLANSGSVEAESTYEIEALINFQDEKESYIITFYTEDAFEQDNLFIWKSEMKRFTKDESNYVLLDFAVLEYPNGEDNANATFYFFNTTINDNRFDINFVSYDLDGTLTIEMKTTLINNYFDELVNVKINGIYYTNVELVEDLGANTLNIIVHDFDVDLSHLTPCTLTDIYFMKNNQLTNVQYQYKFTLSEQIKHVSTTMKPYFYNEKVKDNYGFLWLKKRYSYRKAVFFDLIDSKTGKPITNAYQIQANAVYNKKGSANYIDTIEETKLNLVKKVSDANLDSLKELYNQFTKQGSDNRGYYYNQYQVNDKSLLINTSGLDIVDENGEVAEWVYDDYAIDAEFAFQVGILNISVFGDYIPKDYMWILNTEAVISDFELIYCWYEEKDYIVQGSAYPEGMYTVIEEDGTEAVYNEDGERQDQYFGDHGIIYDRKTNEKIEVDTPSQPDTPDDPVFDDDDDSGISGIWEEIKAFFASIKDNAVKIVLVTIGIVVAVAAFAVFGPTLIVSILKGVVWLITLPFRLLKAIFVH